MQWEDTCKSLTCSQISFQQKLAECVSFLTQHALKTLDVFKALVSIFPMKEG